MSFSSVTLVVFSFLFCGTRFRDVIYLHAITMAVCSAVLEAVLEGCVGKAYGSQAAPVCLDDT